ncbi:MULTISPECIES: prenyltransferase/squalene oxidase repeat-containing protein [Coprobacillaceae]|uniref:prenyltransferase/squalene oxidase repeat-containing protein n=1 Tax=Coprobacillaceae TaxID=2810280 RepID=UPI000E46A75E|nr:MULTISPECIES: prenyltransferase/squalene oxidase repeat-containing protein [Coprobacillaceae]RHM60451.1 hypothetical protein DWZ53_06910 [Coprobacillus sp. AF33-1AC]RHS95848.1 hypothetical protein DW911_02255 [Erysipelatoclostridium sp. AM42-17]
MKMKKIICSLMISVLCFMTAISGVSAANTYDTNKLLDAADKVKAYYKKNGLTKYSTYEYYGQTYNNLGDYLNDMIAYEALGGEVEDDFDISDFESNLNGNISTVNALAKEIIVAKLLKKDPTNLTINGSSVNLVNELESKIDDKGCFGKKLGSNIDIWGLLALESVSSSKVQLVANHIASDINEDGGFWNFDYYDSTKKNSGCDVTGWGIEALSIAGKKQYSSTIQKAIGYLKEQQNDVGFPDYGSVNPDSQACAIEGLSVYNRDDLLNGLYNKNNSNQIDVLLNYQNTDTGSFWYNNAGEENRYATQDAARAMGTIINGSVIYKAIGYGNPDSTLTRVEVKPAQTPTQTENKNDSQSPKKDQTATAVKTGDNTSVTVFVSLSMISAGLFLVLRKENEKAC